MDWMPIETAPRDGTRVRLKGDDGRTFRGAFAAPHWWTIGAGARIADGHLFHDNGAIMRALEWHALPD
jgi:hypothetical protein